MASSRRSSLPFTTFLFHNAVFDRKLLPTDPSMVYLPCLHVTGHIPSASGANVSIRFLLHNAVLHRKLLPTDPSMVYSPCLHVTGHIPFASGANVNIRFFRHNAVLHRELLPTDPSMVYLPCLHVTGHIPFASGANVNIRFLLHNAVLHRKLVPTDPSMGLFALSSRHWPHSLCKRGKRKHTLFPSQRRPSQKTASHRPCLDVTGHIPFASRANIHIPFRNDLRIPHLETVTTCAPVIYLARAYTAPHRLLASGTNILETLAFPRCLCSICQQHHRLALPLLCCLQLISACLSVLLSVPPSSLRLE